MDNFNEEIVCSVECCNSNKKNKESLENKYGMKLIDFKELNDEVPEFSCWLKQIIPFGNIDKNVLMFRGYTKQGDRERFKCKFYTNDYCYSISAIKSSIIGKKKEGYLGCIVTTRKPDVGEHWHRGNDLPDGKYSKETFDRIVRAIVAYEIKELQI